MWAVGSTMHEGEWRQQESTVNTSINHSLVRILTKPLHAYVCRRCPHFGRSRSSAFGTTSCSSTSLVRHVPHYSRSSSHHHRTGSMKESHNPSGHFLNDDFRGLFQSTRVDNCCFPWNVMKVLIQPPDQERMRSQSLSLLGGSVCLERGGKERLGDMVGPVSKLLLPFLERLLKRAYDCVRNHTLQTAHELPRTPNGLGQ